MIIKVRWIIIKENKIFLVKDFGSWKYMLPGWKIEKWEWIIEALNREIKEETWINAKIWDYIWFKEYISNKNEITIQYLFKINNIFDFDNIIRENCSHCHEWSESWFFSFDFIYKNKLDIPLDLKEIYDISLNWWVYNYFL